MMGRMTTPPNFNCHAFDATDAKDIQHLISISAAVAF